MHLPSTPVLEYPLYSPSAAMPQPKQQALLHRRDAEFTSKFRNSNFSDLAPFRASSGKALRAELHRSLKKQNQNSNTLVLQHSISFLSPTSALNILCFHNMLSALLVSF